MQKLVLVPYDRYQQLLTTSHENNSPPPISERDQLATEKSIKATVSNDNFTERVITLFPKSLQARARALLVYVRPYITWNEKEEITISGEEIPNSNIVDLIKVQLKDYKDFQPLGLKQFNLLLKKINVPLSLLAVSKREQTGKGSVSSIFHPRSSRKQNKQEKIPPPPGKRIKRRIQTGKQKTLEKMKWLKL